ncbi:hypothetical protein PCANC_04681 [Puccinia coronata f. sp. avenae]|uniref:Uncharacterized protein n=1 Tax=Puccinia coronata f. sp. avenae TaxID=200324 RepID=A0A2N5W1J9_9BASI|nr:hypothetical protein PCANC_04681 [Puccinia coronata f. sp. avenae]
MTTHAGTTRTKSPHVAWNRHAASLVPYRPQDAAVSVLVLVSVTTVGLMVASTFLGGRATSGGPNRHRFGFGAWNPSGCVLKLLPYEAINPIKYEQQPLRTTRAPNSSAPLSPPPLA